MISVRSFVKRHVRLLRLARWVRFNVFHRSELDRREVYDWSCVSLMVEDWVKFLPKDFDCIVGVGRGGLLVANLLALEMGLPLSVSSCFVRGEVWCSSRLECRSDFRKVLVVDDAVSCGVDLRDVLLYLSNQCGGVEFYSGCLVAHSSLVGWVDYVYVYDSVFMSRGDLCKFDKYGSVKPRLGVVRSDDIG